MNVSLIGDNQDILTELSGILQPFHNIRRNIDLKSDVIIETTTYNRDLKFTNLEMISNNVRDNAVVISNSNVIKLLEQARFIKNSDRFTGISLYPTFSSTKGLEFSITNFSNVNSIQIVEDLFNPLECDKFWVQDKPGMINLRIISLIINEAYLVLQEKTSTKEDIDIAMKLGTNYPYGPIEWSELIGIDTIYMVLYAMYDEFGEDRYRITPLLKEKFLESITV